MEDETTRPHGFPPPPPAGGSEPLPPPPDLFGAEDDVPDFDWGAGAEDDDTPPAIGGPSDPFSAGADSEPDDDDDEDDVFSIPRPDSEFSLPDPGDDEDEDGWHPAPTAARPAPASPPAPAPPVPPVPAPPAPPVPAPASPPAPAPPVPPVPAPPAPRPPVPAPAPTPPARADEYELGPMPEYDPYDYDEEDDARPARPAPQPLPEPPPPVATPVPEPARTESGEEAPELAPPDLTLAIFAETNVRDLPQELEDSLHDADLVISLGHVDLHALAAIMPPGKPALCVFGPRDEYDEVPRPFRALHAGGVTFKGWRIAGFGGAPRRASQPGFYIAEQEARSLLDNLAGCDILISHAPPSGLASAIGQAGFDSLRVYIDEQLPLAQFYARSGEPQADDLGETLVIGVAGFYRTPAIPYA